MSSAGYWLVMPAAGRGKRLGGGIPKQYLPLAGRAMILWSLQTFTRDPLCKGAMVAIGRDDDEWQQLQAQLPARVRETCGGAERADSVRAALAALLAEGAQAGDWVMVHDAARPCVTSREISALWSAVSTHAAAADERAGGLLAVPLADTLKRARARESGEAAAERVAATVSREGLWRALTPQMFRLGALHAALQSAQREQRTPTDEAEAMEWQGAAPLLVSGESTNIKVTTYADLQLAEHLLVRAAGER
jgi:2-C-methyl-D-erythritol 4-phosphate cytidylyltransferase